MTVLGETVSPTGKPSVMTTTARFIRRRSRVRGGPPRELFGEGLHRRAQPQNLLRSHAAGNVHGEDDGHRALRAAAPLDVEEGDLPPLAVLVELEVFGLQT